MRASIPRAGAGGTPPAAQPRLARPFAPPPQAAQACEAFRSASPGGLGGGGRGRLAQRGNGPVARGNCTECWDARVGRQCHVCTLPINPGDLVYKQTVSHFQCGLGRAQELKISSTRPEDFYYVYFYYQLFIFNDSGFVL